MNSIEDRVEAVKLSALQITQGEVNNVEVVRQEKAKKLKEDIELTTLSLNTQVTKLKARLGEGLFLSRSCHRLKT